MSEREGPRQPDELSRRLIRPGSPYELVQTPVGEASPRVFRHAPHSLNDLYQRAASSAAQPCMSFLGRHITYGEMLHQAHALGALLSHRHGEMAGRRAL